MWLNANLNGQFEIAIWRIGKVIRKVLNLLYINKMERAYVPQTVQNASITFMFPSMFQGIRSDVMKNKLRKTIATGNNRTEAIPIVTYRRVLNVIIYMDLCSNVLRDTCTPTQISLNNRKAIVDAIISIIGYPEDNKLKHMLQNVLYISCHFCYFATCCH